MYFLMNNTLSIYEIKKSFYIALLFSYDLRTMWFNFLNILTMDIVNRPQQSVVYMTIFNDTIYRKLIENNMLRKIKIVLWQRIKKVFKYLRVKKKLKSKMFFYLNSAFVKVKKNKIQQIVYMTILNFWNFGFSVIQILFNS